MSDTSRSQLIQELVNFAQKGSRRSLRDFQRLAGWLTHPLTHDDLLWVTQLHCGFCDLLRLGELVLPDEISLRHCALRCAYRAGTFRSFFSGKRQIRVMKGITSLFSRLLLVRTLCLFLCDISALATLNFHFILTFG